MYTLSRYIWRSISTSLRSCVCLRYLLIGNFSVKFAFVYRIKNRKQSNNGRENSRLECRDTIDCYYVSRSCRLIFSERELTYTFAICRRPSVCHCRLSVTFVHPTQAIEIFGNVIRHLLRWPSADIPIKFYGDRPWGTPPSGESNTTGVAEYSNFWPIERYISETVHDRS